MRTTLKLTNEQCVYLPNFYSESVRSRTQTRKHLLYVGRLSREKGLQNALLAVHELVVKRKKHLAFLIVGDGPYKQRLQRLTRKLHLTSQVTFTGRVSHDDIPAYYEGAKAMILPSIWLENNPLTLFEAMQHAVPLIVTDVGGLTDLVKHGKNGFVCPPGRIIQLADSIEHLLFNTQKSTNMGLYGKNKLLPQFSEKHYLTSVLQLYTQMA